MKEDTDFMSHHLPEDLHKQFVAFFNAGDLDGLMTLYERDAALVPQPGLPVAGYEENRRALEQFLALRGRIEITTPIEDPEASGGPVVFDPTRVVDGIELSDDPILRYRAAAYSESVARRTAS